MDESMKLTILSPERQLLRGEVVSSVTLTGSEGEIEILPGYEPMVGTIETGLFSYHGPNDKMGLGVISTGFFEVKDNNVTVMAETIELKGEIDTNRAKLAQQKAEAALQEAGLDEHKFKKYQLKLHRALIRQHVAGRE